MRIIIFVFLFIHSFHSAISQHQIGVHGGSTFAKIVEFKNPNFQPGVVHNDLHSFPVLFSAYISVEYEYTLYPFKLSVGWSSTTFGTSRYFFGNWLINYNSIPVMLGRNWRLPKNFSITLEGGAELGIETSSTLTASKKGRFLALGTLGIDASWKRLRFGVKGHFSINSFREWNSGNLHHSGITTYLGYTLFDSRKAKEKRKKRLDKKKSNN